MTDSGKTEIYIVDKNQKIKIMSDVMLSWYKENKRHFVFRDISDPYQIWISEIMLQQTGTETVEKYFVRFIDRFPDVLSLAKAQEQDVLKLWEGLGYYSRARNLYKAARVIVEAYGGVFPREYASIRKLPGIGDYTAASVSSIAYDDPNPALDGNLKRVFSRVFGIRDNIDNKETLQHLFHTAKATMPEKGSGDYNQSLMDLGALVCTPGTPDCHLCPLRGLCNAYYKGDADRLPKKNMAKSPVTINMAVLILTCGDKAALIKRDQKLLLNMYTFLTFENVSLNKALLFEKIGIPNLNIQYLDHARHVFTHRIWEMDIYHGITDNCDPSAIKAEWFTLEEMRFLPVPTAMRTAYRLAEQIMVSL